MRVTAFIRSAAARGGATARATVYFRVRDNASDIKAASELSICPNYWDAKRQGYKARVSLVSEQRRNAFDIAVQEIAALIAKEYYVGADSRWLKRLIFVYHHPNAYQLRENRVADMTWTAWIERYVKARIADSKQQSIYRSLVRLVQRFELYRQKIEKQPGYVMSIGTMTAADLQALERYIADEYAIREKYPALFRDVRPTAIRSQRNGNYMACVMGRLRSAFLWAVRQGATDNRPFDRYEMPHLVYGTPYYLTLEERNRVYDLDLTAHPHLATHRDTFILQCMIGCRHSDLVRLTADNIVDGAVEYIPAKTRERSGKTVRVPLGEKARVVLERMMNRPRKTKTLVPHISLAIYNEAIRELLDLAGITRNVTVLNPKTHEEEQRPINEIASSHMARRVFVGNLYKQVKDPNLIASMSGHANGSRSFARYRAIDDDIKRELINLIN